MTWDRWIRTVEVEPSLYAADFSRLGEQIDILLRAGARVFHFDIGDGHFVEPVTIGPVVLQSIAPMIHEAGGAIDCHLMVDEPAHYFDAIRKAGGDSVTFHFEAAGDPGAIAEAARAHGFQVGLAFKPGTAVADVVPVADAFDLVLCMSIEPGYSGQQFMPEAFERLRRLRELLPESMHLQVDGGVKRENVQAAREAGANVLVAATAVFHDGDVGEAYRGLLAASA